MNKYLVYVAIFLTSLFCSMTMARASTVIGAACVIDDGFHVVFIEEVLTGKLSLPGGLIGSEETAKQAVERETWEETGLVVTAEKILYQDETSIVYRCSSHYNITVFNQENRNFLFTIPAWTAPHYGVETKVVYFIEPRYIEPQQYRYPNQLEILDTWLTPQLENVNHVVLVNNLIEQAARMHQIELDSLLALRADIENISPIIFNSINKLAILVNSSVSEYGLYFLWVISLVYFGRKMALTMLFFIIITIVSNEFIKQALALPRPFSYVPQLQLTQTMGFGMPSLHIMLSIFIFGFFLFIFKQKDSKWKQYKYQLFFIIFIIIQCATQLWLAVSFISDIVVGCILGMVILMFFVHQYQQNKKQLYRAMTSLSGWLTLSIALSSIAFVMQFASYVYLAAIGWGVFFSLAISKEKPHISVKEKVAIFVASIAVIVTIRFTINMLLAVMVSSSAIVLALKSIQYFVLIISVMLCYAWIPLLFKDKKRPII